MAGRKLKDFLNNLPGSTGAQQIDFVLDDETAGLFRDLGIDPNTHRPLLDLDNADIGLLGNYLEWLMDQIAHPDVAAQSKNAFRAQAGNEAAASSIRGVPIVQADQQGFKRVFVPGGTDLHNALIEWSNSGEFDQAGFSLQDIVDKAVQNPVDIASEAGPGRPERAGEGHFVLSSVKGGAPDQTGKVAYDNTGRESDRSKMILDASQNILTRNNRFTGGVNGDPYVKRNTADAETNDIPISSVQTDYGQYNKAAQDFIFDKLRMVGESMLLKAAGFDSSTAPGSSMNPINPQTGGPFIPDEPIDERGNRRVNPTILKPRNAMGAPKSDSEDLEAPSPLGNKGDYLIADYSDPASQSYGTTYIPGMPFSTISQGVLIAQATAAVIALQYAAKQTDSLLDTLSGYKDGAGDSSQAKEIMGRGPFYLGENLQSIRAKYHLFKTITLVRTSYPYSRAVKMGMKVFFGEKPEIPGEVKKSQHIREAPGFWLAIARSILRSSDNFLNEATDSLSQNFSTASLNNFMFSLGKSKIIGFLNAAATVGDSFLQMTGGKDGLDDLARTGGPYDVDALPDNAATRVMKSRSGDGLTASALAWRGSSVPSMYMIPKNVILTALDMGTLSAGTNPSKGMLGTRLIKKTYLDPNAIGPHARIPSDIVERMENLLDAEYVPFYFHDLRTNEIVAFHAFIDTLTDSYTANYAESHGLGRVDAVQSYQNTSRTITLSFIIAATSKEDFDEMWWKINKLVTLLYPQWSKGQKIFARGPEGKINEFRQPFSQIMRASPVIRLRVGDVLKSNYSKFNLARIFGIGDLDTLITDADGTSMGGFMDFLADMSLTAGRTAMNILFYLLFGSPLATLLSGISDPRKARIARGVVGNLLTNGFLNPLGATAILWRLRDPDSVRNPMASDFSLPGKVQSVASKFMANSANTFGYIKGEIHYLKATEATYYRGVEGKRWKVLRPLRVMIQDGGSELIKDIESKKILFQTDTGTMHGPQNTSMKNQKKLYRVKVFDFNAPYELFWEDLMVSHADIMPNPASLYNNTLMPFIGGFPGIALAISNFVTIQAAQLTGIPADTLQPFATTPAKFMSPEINPVVKSFNSTRGRGLAGVIKSMRFDWMEHPWEIDWGSRAPKACKVSIQFDPIHDISPGLDYSGYNRAPIYNVGQIMENVAGDPYDDDGIGSKASFTSAGRVGTRREDDE